MSNDYNALAGDYKKTDVKPDKHYSILPTVLLLAGDLHGKTVVDLGCGSGFFTRRFAETVERVIGIDNSEMQIDLARRTPQTNVEYRVGDIMEDDLPPCDVVNMPFVIGYCATVGNVQHLLKNAYLALRLGGQLIGVIDLPSGKDLKKFGATKILHGVGDGAKLDIVLCDVETPICTLHATYFTRETVASLLAEVGFADITWHAPIVSAEGVQNMPNGYWNGYVDNSELGYFTATKV